jgi:hypothetical protein
MKKQTANKTGQTKGRFSACLLSETTGQPKLPRDNWDSRSCREKQKTKDTVLGQPKLPRKYWDSKSRRETGTLSMQ